MELEYTDKVAIIYKVEKSGLNDLLQVKYDNLICQYDTTIYKYDWRNEKSASRFVYSEHRNKNYDTRIV